MELPKVNELQNFYRLGPTKEKDLFKRHKDTYSGVFVPAHIASYYSKFCAEFLGSLRKPYFIDPITHIFAQDPEHLRRFVKTKDGKTKRDKLGIKLKGDIKRSYKKLVFEEYGGIVKDTWTKGKSLAASEMSDVAVATDFARKVIDFQRSVVAQLPSKYTKYRKYAKKAGVEISEAPNPPAAIIPPYFLATSKSDPWNAINLNMVEIARTLETELPIYPVILTTMNRLRLESDTLVKSYAELGINGAFIWITDFPGGQTDSKSLKFVADFVTKLSNRVNQVSLFYGDSFSLVLARFGLSGFSCGICYGEKKEVGRDVDMEGQIPARYYIATLKQKFRIDTTMQTMDFPKAHPELVCDCAICSRKPNPADQSDSETKEHFMLARSTEIRRLNGFKSNEELARTLSDAHAKYNSHPQFGPTPYLKNWAELLRS